MKEYQKFQFLSQIQEHSVLFKAVYQLGVAKYTDKIPTACVMKNKQDNQLYYFINYDFFWSLTEKERLFIVCHESLHLLFGHLDYIEKEKLDTNIANVAMDIVINETLLQHFNFNRNELSFTRNKNNDHNICLIDTVFTDEEIKKFNINFTKGFKYIYQCLSNKYKNQHDQENQQALDNMMSIDEHQPNPELLNEVEIHNDEKQNTTDDLQEQDGKENNSVTTTGTGSTAEIENDTHQDLSNNSNNNPEYEPIDKDFLDEIIDKIESECNVDIQKLQDIIHGQFKPENIKNFNNLEDYISKDFSLFKKKTHSTWKKLINFVNPSIIEQKEIIDNSFGMPNYSIGMVLEEEGIFLPGLKKDEEWRKDKIDLYFFFDVSGSCYSYKNTFLKIISDIPTSMFKLHLFAFSNYVLPIEIDYKNKKFKTKLSSGYATSFTILEEQIQKDLQNRKIQHYPDFVCVLTDGIAPPINNIKDKNQPKWLWLLITPEKVKKTDHLSHIIKKAIIPFHDQSFDILNPKINHKIKNGCKIYPIDKLIQKDK